MLFCFMDAMPPLTETLFWLGFIRAVVQVLKCFRITEGLNDAWLATSNPRLVVFAPEGQRIRKLRVFSFVLKLDITI